METQNNNNNTHDIMISNDATPSVETPSVETLDNESLSTVTHCGFVAIVGRPNVGKSTLMNHLIGQKISITSRKPQTTQYKINGVCTESEYQYIFVDTPGFQKRYINKLNTLLNKSVISSLTNVDAVLFVVEAGFFNTGDAQVLDLMPKDANVILVVNKQDKIKDKMELDRFVKEIKGKFTFKETLLVAAKHHLGTDVLLSKLRSFMPLGEFLYPEEQLTDRNSTFLAKEIIREKLFRYLGEELPYSLAVDINEFKEEPSIIRISATIIVDKENQKGMVIGKSGEKLKKVSSEARVDMEELFGNKVFLQVWVKVKTGFAEEAKFLKQFE
ncbi:MAG: GTPase Era [Proteobacteria bacterium]|jgi:GTP-binding protein Era|nr:GTPase Era [Pseudomonadota bacterium]